MAGRDVVDAVTAPAMLAELRRLGVIPVATIDDPTVGTRVGQALVDGGLPCIEVTLRTPAALAVIEALRASLPELVVGAGTVLTVEQASAAIAAGARFLASPGYDDEVVAWCHTNELLVLPGVMTPTEMMRARRAGLEVVKFFPASAAGGPSAIAAAAAVFPDLSFVPTGGVGPVDACDYLRLGAVAAVGGSWMVDRRLVAAGDLGRVTALASEAMGIVAQARPGSP